MELEDYRKQMNDLKNEESKIASKMYALKKKYIGELPFKVGDRVELKNYGIGWIMSISMSDCGTLNINYYPPKRTVRNQTSIEVLGV